MKLAKLFMRLASSRRVHKVVDDWAMAAACTLEASPWHQMRMTLPPRLVEAEKDYLQAIKGYSADEVKILAEALAEFIAIADAHGDPLAELYSELELTSSRAGQFFTPWSLSELMGQMMIGDLAAEVEKKGYASISDPACGAGTTLLAAASAAEVAGVDVGRLFFHGCDIDLTVSNLAFINLAARGYVGVIEHGDTLRVEVWRRRFTPAYVMGGWSRRRAEGMATSIADVGSRALPEPPVDPPQPAGQMSLI